MFKTKSKVIAACTLALVLIVASVVIRYTNTQKINNELSYVDNGNTQNQDKALANSIDGTASSTNLEASAINQTDIVSQKLFASYMVLQNSGNLNADTATSLVNDITSGIDASVTPQYQANDLIIISTSTVSVLKNYANKFWAIRTKYVNLYKQHPLGSADFVADPSNPSFITGFVATGDLYIQMATELSKLPVPAELTDLHLKLLNNYVASGLGLKKLQQLNSDPIATISGLSTFSQYSDYETTILSIMAQYFSKSGIIFSSSDPGIGWNTI
jgi:general stress protein CsbA